MATNEELYQYYKDLLILQYRNKPKASATIEALVSHVIMDQLPLKIRDAFNPDNAVGAQLDILAKYAGVSRTEQGITLNDKDFRTLIKFAYIKNSLYTSLYDIQRAIFDFFGGQILVFDYLKMRMGYFINTTVWSVDLVNLALKTEVLPFPMAVARTVTIFTDTGQLGTFFGFRTYEAANNNATPFNTYDDYNNDWPWITYLYAFYSDDFNMLTEDGFEILQENGDALLLD